MSEPDTGKGKTMLDKLSSATLALTGLFMLLTILRASSGDTSIWLSWAVYGALAAVFGLLTVLLRHRIAKDEERRGTQAETEKRQQAYLDDADRRYTMSILTAEPTGQPGRYLCEVEIEEDPR